MKTYLITGGCGFIGSKLASAVLERGDKLFLFDNLYRSGTSENLRWLQGKGDFKFFHSDIRSYHDVERAVLESKPDVIFHLAGQVAMTTSIQNPRLDFETNVVGGHNVLESVRRHVPKAIVTYSSTNKVYGDLEYLRFDEEESRYVLPGYEHGLDEQVRLDFRSPYGCSKGAVDQYMMDYARIFGLKTIIFRHSSVFGDRQFSTFDQGWVGWFVQKALEAKAKKATKPFTISGNGKQVRDLLFADDLVQCYFKAVANIDRTAGQAYNIGGGPANSLSLLELFTFLETTLDVKLNFEKLPWRESDQKVFIADIRKAEKDFGWKPGISKSEGLKKMIEWVRGNATA